MSTRVQLEFFEGPLDLLLHLIKKNEVSITDIPIATITEQYLATLELMETFSLDVAGEFLVMAATLIHIKSRMLLPAGDAAPKIAISTTTIPTRRGSTRAMNWCADYWSTSVTKTRLRSWSSARF